MKRQGVVITLAVLAGVAGALITLVAGFLTAWQCSSGEGGAPYVSPESPQADVCSATGDGIALIVLGIAAAGGLAVAAVFAGRAWIRGSQPGILFAVLVIGAALTPVPLTWLHNAPSDECTGETAEAYQAWLDAGGHGEPPADCATY